MKKILTTILLTGLLFSMAMAQTAANPVKTAKATASGMEGWISDAKCGSKIDKDCAKKCQESGEKMVFVDSKKNILPIANQDAVKGFAGEHVQLKGKVADGALTITAGSIKKLAS